jgi:xanthine dehydrogenase accessory factor
VPITDRLVVIRGGGDLATGVAWRLTRAGFGVLALELSEPLTVRRAVALSTAVIDGHVDIEGMIGRRVGSVGEALATVTSGEVAVMVSPVLKPVRDLLGSLRVVVDARLAKRPLDTTIGDATTVIALGPGFVVAVDCHAVVETNRGHHLGRVLWSGAADPDTGTPGLVGGKAAERVVRATVDGTAGWLVEIGDVVAENVLLGGVVDDEGSLHEIRAPFPGVVRGLIRGGQRVTRGLKIGDIDPRSDPTMCFEISDKALAIGGGVVEAIFAAGHRI